MTTQRWDMLIPARFWADWEPLPGDSYGIGKFTADPDLAVISDGILTLTTAQTPDGTWRSPQYRTRKNYLYGRFEARLKLPSAKGVWPAFWMVDWNMPVGHATTSEIDIMEAIGACDRLYTTIHGTPGTWGQREKDVPIPNRDDWHVYACDWRADRITFYLDGAMVASWGPADCPSWPFTNPLYLVLDLAVGGWPGLPDTTTPPELAMLVDYISVTA